MSGADTARVRTGDVLDGRYLLQEELGGGAFGTVFRAEHRVHGITLRAVAVKVLHDGPDDGPDHGPAARDAMLREALRMTRTVERCTDPWVRDRFVTCLDVTTGDRPHLVMELAQENLAQHVRDAQLPVDTARDRMRQLCAGVAYLHEHGLLHLDLKPGNVLVVPGDRLKIGDFGAVARIGTLVAGDGPRGTLAYQPPEVLQGRTADARADVYALGMIAHELLTGRLPHEARLLAVAGSDSTPSRTAELIELKHLPVPPLEALNPVLAGDPFAQLVLQSLDPTASGRPADAGAMLRALEATESAIGSGAAPRPAGAAAGARELTDRLRSALGREGTTAAFLRATADEALAANDGLPDDAMVTGLYPLVVDEAMRVREVDRARLLAQRGLARRRCRDTVCAMAAAFAGTPVGRAFAVQCRGGAA